MHFMAMLSSALTENYMATCAGTHQSDQVSGEHCLRSPSSLEAPSSYPKKEPEKEEKTSRWLMRKKNIGTSLTF